MEPSQDLASEGEFSGTESGWTTYIGSPIPSEVYDDDDEESVNMEDYVVNKFKNAHEKVHDDDDDKGEKNDVNEESDDDSMASDASSGPCHLQLVCIKSETSHGLHVHEEKFLSTKKASKQVKKTKCEGLFESLVVADSASSHV
ncbi:protein SOB FIVE-LIKE 1-like [Vicia villosa]|uniref:protein SOB FIVE-LIKE 1-like n=1 Tax=Vicia villosa TaxID=3911 RepID=UPI00273BE0CC|nr:protein SOB FIVE-LIKE 1-like [Vicia villosa]